MVSAENVANRNNVLGPTGTDCFALAAISKVSLIHGNEHRHDHIDRAALRRLCSLLIAVKDPFIDDNKLSSFLVRIGHEQFPYQELPMRPLGRTYALLIDAAAEANQDIINAPFWEQALGCTLEQFVQIAVMLFGWAQNSSGRLVLGNLDQSDYGPMLRVLPRAVIEAVIAQHFVATVAEFKQIAAEYADPNKYNRRYEFNALTIRPFVMCGSTYAIAPVQRHIWGRATPGSLYYVGCKHGGKHFTNALGACFEKYVGKQLHQIDGAAVSSEIVFNGDKSVDYIVILPSVVILIEAKATPLKLSSRIGGDSLTSDIDRAPGKGIRQLLATAKLVRSRHPQFAHVPIDRPMVGLVVTLETYHACNNSFVLCEEQSELAVALISVGELEGVAVLDSAELQEILVDLSARRENAEWRLSEKLSGRSQKRNAILHSAWSKYEFPRS